MNIHKAETTVKVLILLAVGGMAGAASFTHVHDWTMHNSPAGTPGWFGWANAVISELTPIAAGLEIGVAGCGAEPINAFDVTDAWNPRHLTGLEETTAGTRRVRFSASHSSASVGLSVVRRAADVLAQLHRWRQREAARAVGLLQVHSMWNGVSVPSSIAQASRDWLNPC